MRDRGAEGTTSMRVNPIRCEGVGMCAHLAPGVVTIDPWGFPMFPLGPLSAEEIAQAERAVLGCPKQALILDGSA